MAARGSARQAHRANEYWIPKDGIDREVITADICRYLGNDALVRPGPKDDPATGRRVEGYIINGYRNLTSAMIADLKADSARWDQERRSAARSNAHVPYLDSQTHHSRQINKPTDATTPVPAHAAYSGLAGNSGQSAYDSSGQYPPSGYSQAQPLGYGGQPQFDSNYYEGANMRMEVDDSSRRGVPPPVTGFSGAPSGYAAPRTTYPQEDSRYAYSQPVAQQPGPYTQPIYDGRASASVPTTYAQQMDSSAPYDQGGFRDSSYPAQGGFSQASMDSSYGTTGPVTSRRGDRRDPDPRESRDRRRHH